MFREAVIRYVVPLKLVGTRQINSVWVVSITYYTYPFLERKGSFLTRSVYAMLLTSLFTLQTCGFGMESKMPLKTKSYCFHDHFCHQLNEMLVKCVLSEKLYREGNPKDNNPTGNSAHSHGRMRSYKQPLIRPDNGIMVIINMNSTVLARLYLVQGSSWELERGFAGIYSQSIHTVRKPKEMAEMN